MLVIEQLKNFYFKTILNLYKQLSTVPVFQQIGYLSKIF